MFIKIQLHRPNTRSVEQRVIFPSNSYTVKKLSIFRRIRIQNLTSITQLYTTNIAAEKRSYLFLVKISSTFEALFLRTYSPKVLYLENFDTSCDILKYHRRFVPQKHFTNNVTQVVYQNIDISLHFHHIITHAKCQLRCLNSNVLFFGH